MFKDRHPTTITHTKQILIAYYDKIMTCLYLLILIQILFIINITGWETKGFNYHPFPHVVRSFCLAADDIFTYEHRGHIGFAKKLFPRSLPKPVVYIPKSDCPFKHKNRRWWERCSRLSMGLAVNVLNICDKGWYCFSTECLFLGPRVWKLNMNVKLLPHVHEFGYGFDTISIP